MWKRSSNIARNDRSQQPAVGHFVAPWPHTVFILGVLVLWAVYGAFRVQLPVHAFPHGVTYTSSIVIQSLLVGSTVAGLYHRRKFIDAVVGPISTPSIMRDLRAGIAIFFGALVCLVLFRAALRALGIALTSRHDAVLALAPRNIYELLLWFAVSLFAGVCEEFVFRGYLQQQMTHWFRNALPAIGICSLLFGTLHFYQGTAGALQTALLGLIYGLVAHERGNLRSVMLAHFLQDAFAGTILFLRHA